ncbi:MAG: MATE family efflux transporter [Christensenellales bacterium]|jgi:putative MATE family efflux protein
MQKFKSLIGWGDSRFFKHWLSLALPIMLQQGLASALYLIDNIMVGQLGESAIAAVGVANQLTFLLQVFGFGINSGAGIFAAQYWGKNDKDGIHRIQGIALTLSVALGALFMVAALLFGHAVSDVFSNDPAVIALSAKYLAIIGWSYLFQLVSQTLSIILRACGSPMLPMIATLAGVCTNGVLNYIFIFGHLGLPAMGVEGAALATLIAAIVSTGTLIAVSVKKKMIVAAPFKKLFSFSKSLFREFLKISLPVFFNEALWSSGISMYSILWGILGTEFQASMQIYTTVDRIGFVMMAGLGSAASVITGNSIGEGKLGQAKLYSGRMLVLTPLAVLLFGLVLQGFAPVFMGFFDVTPTVSAMALSVIRVYCGAMFIYALNYTIIIGTLRAGGDTAYASAVDLLGLWVVSIPLAFLCGLVFGLPIWAVYLATISGDIVKAVMGLRRLRTGKWIKVLD